MQFVKGIVPKMMFFVLFLATIIGLSLLFWIGNIFTYIWITDEGARHIISPSRWLVSLIIPLIIVQAALKKRSLDRTGAYASFLVGFVLTLSNYCFAVSLLTFFVVGSKATNFRKQKKSKMEMDFKEGGQRNWIQVLCNGGVATELAILYMIERGCGEHIIDFSRHYTQSWLCMAILGTLSCSCGDTLASEIGSVLSRSQPRLITTLRTVPRGTNGGVSFTGFVVSALGGLIVGASYYCMLLLTTSADRLETSPPQWPIVAIATGAGLLGSLVDSYLGATVQFSGFDEERQTIVEKPLPHVTHISGLSILDNHSVNLLSTLIMAILTPYMAFSVWAYVK